MVASDRFLPAAGRLCAGDDGGSAVYLKRLELVGFKSFAEKTRLDFEPGMMAIVGPNGCGKSNIADAVRWVLGEQSAKALRGSRMEDCIFNGTDAHKPLGMAEVSMTLADCETTLGTAFHEVTVTRRVHRSGEGEYFMNRTPCRLKDIQRLFMDTGVGTNSYSLMEQGRIDRILSSRPEDRRSVFEEASGITKFKADKKEALRKLESTEANLLRLADILREVKRQIISLQRQAGKARRYQALRDQLRGYDLYFTRERLKELEAGLGTLDARRAGLAEREDAAAADVRGAEEQVHGLRSELAALEAEIENAREQMLDTEAEAKRTREMIRVGAARIAELTEVSERDAREADQTRATLQTLRAGLERLDGQHAGAAGARDEADARAEDKAAALKACEDRIAGGQDCLHRLRIQALELETRVANLQKELAAIDADQRSATLRRERLGAERAGLQRALEQHEQRRADMDARLGGLRAELERAAGVEAALRSQGEDRARTLAQTAEALAAHREQAAGRRAEHEVLQRGERDAEGFPGGARLLLEPGAGREGVLGALAAHLDIDAPYRTAAEAVLRPWFDAVVVRDEAAAAVILRELRQRKAGSVRLLTAGPAGEAGTPVGPGEPLAAHVRAPDALRPLLQRLLGAVRVVDELDPSPAPSGDAPPILVTRDGRLRRGRGAFELWAPEDAGGSPIARRQQLRACEEDLARLAGLVAACEEQRGALQRDEGAAAGALREAVAATAEARRNLALAEGENQALSREEADARQRVETVAFELETLVQQGSSGDERRTAVYREIEQFQRRQGEIRAESADLTQALQKDEQERSARLGEATEARLAAADRRREVEALEQRHAAQQDRVEELETLVRERARGVTSYRQRIEDLHRETAAATDSLQPLDDEVNLHRGRMEQARGRREAARAQVEQTETDLHARRGLLEELRRTRGQAEVQLAEQRMRRQNLLERTTGEYRVTDEDIRAAADPDWGEAGAPESPEALESLLTEMRTRLDSMGPVNLVAIEEYEELEKRHEFLTGQHDDLVRAKQQLMDMIRRINKTTTELFSETFRQVNANFQEMFHKLFGGGSAKLVLVDEEDVLESGIEIIARPPGKKLQSVSLLSGGERTMTAVALLFGLYLVKPSPFCVLDELDAALDDANINRFVDVVKDFVTQSQFVVITHNRRTIAAANALFGVTMQHRGVSRIVSVRFSPDGHAEPAGAVPEPAAN